MRTLEYSRALARYPCVKLFSAKTMDLLGTGVVTCTFTPDFAQLDVRSPPSALVAHSPMPQEPIIS